MAHTRKSKWKKGYVVQQMDEGKWAWFEGQPVYDTKKIVDERISKLKKEYPNLKFRASKVEYQKIKVKR